MPLISVLLAVVISLLWYLPSVWAQGKNRTLRKKDYLKAAFLYGLVYCCFLIIITEIIWDAIFGRANDSQIVKMILSDFFRAALIEEFFKFTGFLMAKSDLKPKRKIDYILIAGIMGLVYSIVEKAVLGNIGAVIIGLTIPMHILWQFNQGGHFYEYEKIKQSLRAEQENPSQADSEAEKTNKKLAGKELFMAVAVPFLFHGLWDSAISFSTYCIGVKDSNVLPVIGGVMILGILAVGIIYTVMTLKKVRRIAKEESLVAEPSVE